jgi:hypothetical protein
VQLGERAGQGARVAGQRSAGRVGAVLARPRDGELHDGGGDGRHDGEDERGDESTGAALLVAVGAAEPEDGAPLDDRRDHRDDRRDHRSDAGDQDVAVPHVRDLVGEDAAELAIGQQTADAAGHRHHCVLRVAAGGERVGRVLVDEVDAGHRNACARRELGDHLLERRIGAGRERAGAVHRQHQAIAPEVAGEVHEDGEPAEDPHGGGRHRGADGDQDGGQDAEEGDGLELVQDEGLLVVPT